MYLTHWWLQVCFRQTRYYNFFLFFFQMNTVKITYCNSYSMFAHLRKKTNLIFPLVVFIFCAFPTLSGPFACHSGSSLACTCCVLLKHSMAPSYREMFRDMAAWKAGNWHYMQPGIEQQVHHCCRNLLSIIAELIPVLPGSSNWVKVELLSLSTEQHISTYFIFN